MEITRPPQEKAVRILRSTVDKKLGRRCGTVAHSAKSASLTVDATQGDLKSHLDSPRGWRCVNAKDVFSRYKELTPDELLFRT